MLAPSFVYTPKNIQTTEGKALSLRLSFSGKPMPDPSWSLNGNKIESGNHFDIKTDSGKTILSIKSCELTDAGTYCCTISNKAGSVSFNCEVSIDEAQYRPQFIEKVKEESTSEGQNVRLSVQLKAKPKASVTVETY